MTGKATIARWWVWGAAAGAALLLGLTILAVRHFRHAGKKAAPLDGPRAHDGSADGGVVAKETPGVADVAVVVSAGTPPYTVVVAQPSGQTSHTSSDGNFHFVVADGPYVLYAYDRDRRAQAIVCAASPSPITLSLTAAIATKGDVLDVSRAPVPSAHLVWHPLFAESACAALSVEMPLDAQANFTLLRPAVEGAVEAQAEGYWPQVARLPASTATLHLQLEAASSIEGVVNDERGQPVVGARLALVTTSGGSAVGAASAWNGADPRVRPSGELGILPGPVPFPPIGGPGLLLPSASGKGGSDGPLLTDQSGHFSVPRVVPGEVTVTASQPQFASSSVQVEVRAGQKSTLTITLADGLSVEGQVHDGDGNGIAGAEVALLDGTATRSDGGGHFHMDHAVSGQSLTVRHAGFRPGRAAVAATVDVTLERADHALAGVVVDSRGTPVGGAELTIGGGTDALHAVTDRDGRFSAVGLGAPPHTIHVGRAGFAPLSSVVNTDDNDLHLELSWGAGIDGTIKDDRTGDVPPGSRAELRAGGQTIALSVASGRGTFSGTGLPVGAATLHVWAPGWVDASRTIDLPPAEHAGDVSLHDLDVRLARGGAVAGTITGSDGNPAAGVSVHVGERRVRTDGQGHFRVDGVPSGSVHFTVYGADPSQPAIDDDLDVRPGEESAADATMP